ncbi:MAG: N-acetylmuramoyl-L-alanine amidase family protein [Christensenellales bacterium]|jgi:N-acetylmuramoyl-L-alanine amidase
MPSKPSKADSMRIRPVIVIIIAAMALVGAAVVWAFNGADTAAAPTPLTGEFTVLIDAGHGGFDIGCKGTVTGVEEAELNLDVAKELERKLRQAGANIIMTRDDENAIGGTKDEDMQNRREIINKSGADIMISIHMNSFPDDPQISGPQVFYYDGSVKGAELAGIIQNELNSQTGGNRGIVGSNYYVLRAGNMPSVIVECGFLTNSRDEELLSDAAYRKKLAGYIAEAAVEYLNVNGG